ncbi:hypothetical protein CROQUDRAFT_91475 [Cronartium quercuum f. sp. fusiforme G11]|uniref:Uncharacterized protein n=1 Tax=Cronartium quercuum f. sp. fusiforme G11 TaxID=708437 RepID=A0A9P6TD71_9BASI|nr:hypothetical protein CROQUDRAFT_91475 [Cronartium quercuum f. sp. fusiforme G11]
MSSPEELKLISQVLSIPRSQNPYIAASAYLDQAITSPSMELWARKLLMTFIVGYVDVPTMPSLDLYSHSNKDISTFSIHTTWTREN